MTDIELRNEDGVIVGYDRETGEKIPVSFESLKANNLTSTATAGDTWAGMNKLLEEGYCVSSLGNVYGPAGTDADAAQKAVDDIVTDGARMAWIGAGTFNGVTISSTELLPGRIIGMGRDSYLDGGTSGPGLLIENPNYGQIGTARLEVENLAVTSGGSQPGLKTDGAHELLINGLQIQSPGGIGAQIVDTARSQFENVWMEGCGSHGLQLEYAGNKQTIKNTFGDLFLSTYNGYCINIKHTNPPGGDIYNQSITGGHVDYDQAIFGYLQTDGGAGPQNVIGPLSGAVSTSRNIDTDDSLTLVGEQG